MADSFASRPSRYRSCRWQALMSRMVSNPSWMQSATARLFRIFFRPKGVLDLLTSRCQRHRHGHHPQHRQGHAPIAHEHARPDYQRGADRGEQLRHIVGEHLIQAGAVGDHGGGQVAEIPVAEEGQGSLAASPPGSPGGWRSPGRWRCKGRRTGTSGGRTAGGAPPGQSPHRARTRPWDCRCLQAAQKMLDREQDPPHGEHEARLHTKHQITAFTRSLAPSH